MTHTPRFTGTQLRPQGAGKPASNVTPLLSVCTTPFLQGALLLSRRYLHWARISVIITLKRAPSFTLGTLWFSFFEGKHFRVFILLVHREAKRTLTALVNGTQRTVRDPWTPHRGPERWIKKQTNKQKTQNEIQSKTLNSPCSSFSASTAHSCAFPSLSQSLTWLMRPSCAVGQKRQTQTLTHSAGLTVGACPDYQINKNKRLWHFRNVWINVEDVAV